MEGRAALGNPSYVDVSERKDTGLFVVVIGLFGFVLFGLF
jgi:hypothetical protein